MILFSLPLLKCKTNLDIYFFSCIYSLIFFKCSQIWVWFRLDGSLKGCL